MVENGAKKSQTRESCKIIKSETLSRQASSYTN